MPDLSLNPWEGDVGKELLRVGDWVLFVDYQLSPPTPRRFAAIGHCCQGEEWRIIVGLTGIRDKRCSACSEPIPEELIGFQKLVNWDR